MGWGRNDGYSGGWAPYVSVGDKKRKAAKYADKVAKKQKRLPSPVVAAGRKMATSFWGLAWCDNLESYQDYSNRLPRGATYLRNGSVVDLVIKPSLIEAIVAGSTPYQIKIEIQPLKSVRWKAIQKDCAKSIDSLLDLLTGKLSDGVMKRLTDQKSGLFPAPSEIKMRCNCPDYSSCCKHLAAVMYGIGTRLDSQPELLFVLRGVDHTDLISQAIASGNLERELSGTSSGGLNSNDLESIFGIELDASPPAGRIPKPAKRAKTLKQQPTKAEITAARRRRLPDSSTRGKQKPEKTKIAAASAKIVLTSAKKTAAGKSAAAKPRTSRVDEKQATKKPTTRKSAAESPRTNRVVEKHAAIKPARRKSGAIILAKRANKKTMSPKEFQSAVKSVIRSAVKTGKKAGLTANE